MPLPAYHTHWDVWAVLTLLAVGYWYAEHRLRPLLAPMSSGATRRQWVSWYSGVFVIGLMSTWPVHDIAEESLFTAHMLEHMLIGYVVPPLLLNGMSRWLADATLGNRRVVPWLRPLAHPVVGFFAFNITIVAIHWPRAIEIQNTSEGLHFAAHVAMFVAGILMWLPVYSPTPHIRRLGAPMQMLYLFLNTIIPTVPASFITFSSTALYPVYGDGPARWGLTLISDQTIAGLVMKLGGGFYLIAIILSIWVRYNRDERRWDAIERELADTSTDR